MYSEYIGSVAAILTTIEIIPQVIKSFKTKSVKDFSFSALTMTTVGLLLWAIYGILKKDIWISLSSSFTTLFYFSLLALKVKNNGLRFLN